MSMMHLSTLCPDVPDKTDFIRTDWPPKYWESHVTATVSFLLYHFHLSGQQKVSLSYGR